VISRRGVGASGGGRRAADQEQQEAQGGQQPEAQQQEGQDEHGAALRLRGTRRGAFLQCAMMSNIGMSLGGFICYVFHGADGQALSVAYTSHFLPVCFVIGVAIALWAVSIVYTIITNPDEVPLISRILGDLGEEEKLITLIEEEGDVTVSTTTTARGVILLIFFLFLFGSLGTIVSGLITGGVKVLTAGSEAKNKDRR